MDIHVALDRARLFGWHKALLTALANAGHTVFVTYAATSEPLATSLTAILDFDHARGHADAERFSHHLKPASFAAFSGERRGPESDITIDLATATRVTRHAGRVLRPHFNGSPRDTALFHALLAERAPVMVIDDTAFEACCWPVGLPAITTPWRLDMSLDQVSSRLVEGILSAVARAAAGETPPPGIAAAHVDDEDGGAVFSSAGSFIARRTAHTFGRLRDHATGDVAKWHVAWRRVAADSQPVAGLLTLNDFQILPDDGRRYFADPFLFVHEGVRHVFVEELPDDTGRGIISHFTIAADGTAGPLRVVLDLPHHLSYPQVFAHEGAIYMLPEQQAAGGLDLYRAERFPDRWVVHQRLIDGRLHDATLFQHDGRFWIAAGNEAFQSASWDGLVLYSAPRLEGPWTAHARNPVRVDARSTRPAGPLWMDGAHLIRPTQDCSTGYGGQVTLNRIERLDEGA
ncbi:MAG: glucosamine inositolphosphorylceramide transferase family protein, partial [Hyphomicrobium sp.]